VKPAKLANPTVLREVAPGTRVRLVDGRVLWVTADCSGDVYARLVADGYTPLQWYQATSP